MSILAKIILWRHFSKIDISTLCLESTFVLAQNIRSMHDIELFTIRVDSSITCEHPAGDVRESSSWPTELVTSFFHQFELLALKSLVIIEQIGISSFILLRSKSKCTQNFQILHYFDLGNDIYRLKNIFNLASEFLLLNNYLKYRYHLVLLEEYALYNRYKRHLFSNC